MTIDLFTAARNASIEEAREWLADPDCLILDTETTDLDGEVVQVAIMDMQGLLVFLSLVKPLEAISAGAQAVHGISLEMVERAPTWAELFPVVNLILKDRKLIAYNASFDERMLFNSGWRRDLPGVQAKSWFCAMILYAQFVGEWNDYHGSFRWQKLPGGDHTAQGDCLATLKVIQEMANSAEEA